MKALLMKALLTKALLMKALLMKALLMKALLLVIQLKKALPRATPTQVLKALQLSLVLQS